MNGGARRVLWTALLVVGVLGWCARELNNVRCTLAPGGDAAQGWFSVDADSQYHMRRVERALDEGLPLAERDPRMDSPHGAAIPWPPYYGYVLYALLAPFVPNVNPARRESIERGVASLPCALAVLAALVIALAAWRATRKLSTGTRALAALVAGLYYALSAASFEYSAPGIGDHHAWVALLFATLLALTALGLEDEALADRKRSLGIGVALGSAAGLLIGSWVGGLVYVVLIELALGVALLVHVRRARSGLPVLGLAFHLAWAAAIAPAVLSSPWKEAQPWMMVNLSWLHLVHPLLGAGVFAPLLLARSEHLRRAWPTIVAAGIVALGAFVATGDGALARGVREGFAWAGRRNEFMAFVSESQPLAWGQIGGFDVALHMLGFGALLVVPAWLWIVRRTWKHGGLELAALAVAIPPLLVQALLQRRFADAFGVPMSIALGVAIAHWASRREWRVVPGFALGAVVALVLQGTTLYATTHRLATGQRYLRGPQAQDSRSSRELYRWIRAHGDGEHAVLASWDHGHAIEWVAGQPSIATNFGSYLGEASYLDPWRFFLEEDPVQAEAILAARRARYVLVPGDFTKDLEVMLRILRPDERRSYLTLVPNQPPYVSQRFFSTLVGRLMTLGRAADLQSRALTGTSLDFLRLVHVAPEPLAVPAPIRHTNGPQPAGWVWEYVQGARVEAHGAPGDELALSIVLDVPGLEWIGAARCDASGVARARVPYCTDAPNGDVRARWGLRWKLGERSGEIAVPHSAVAHGTTIEIP